MAIEFHSATASETFAGGNLVGDALEERWARMRVGIDKDEPIAGSGGCAGVSGAGDLVDGFEDDFRSGRLGDLGGLVCRVVVADDEFGFPAPLRECGKRGVNVAQSFAQAPFFVVGWDDDRDFQTIDLRKYGGTEARMQFGAEGCEEGYGKEKAQSAETAPNRKQN